MRIINPCHNDANGATCPGTSATAGDLHHRRQTGCHRSETSTAASSHRQHNTCPDRRTGHRNHRARLQRPARSKRPDNADRCRIRCFFLDRSGPLYRSAIVSSR
uniref:(northern house mosquito) hypothetical protein n=1 Tax=Culex pipiens TaxID=7175 RepID=A0A8D8A7C2_CULPI